MKAEKILHVRNLSFSYPEKELLHAISIDIQSGCITSLQGRNGAGKSTLLKCIAGIVEPAGGEITINDVSMSKLAPLERSRHIGVLWTDRIRIAGFTIQDLVRMGTYNVSKSAADKEIQLIVEESMTALGIAHLATRPLDQVSDGELQKGMIARALAQQPDFLLLDEPTTYLDYVAKEELMQTLQLVCSQKGIGILFTSHDLEIIRNYAHNQLEISNATLTRLN
jgi:iron complex transport system ATP-binding protein